MSFSVNNLLLVAFGGAAGSIARYLVICMSASSALATLIVNTLGSLLIGMAIAVIGADSQHYSKFLLVTGFLGGFTTFASFSKDVFQLWQFGDYRTLFLHVLLSILMPLIAVVLGYYFVTKFTR